MSEVAARQRLQKQGWAAPGGLHDHLVAVLKVGLPIVIGILLAFLAMAPLTKRQDISFILDKNKVAVAKERMRVESARYSGQDDHGRPFTLAARSAIQATSRDPIVDVRGMTAQILLNDGPASLRADTGRYDLEAENVAVVGPIDFLGPRNYRLTTRDVTADLNRQYLESSKRVDGTMPLGYFSADRLQARLADRHVILDGNARLHIVQGGLRGAR